MKVTPQLSRNESLDAILDALEIAKVAGNNPAIHSLDIKCVGLMPSAVSEAAKTLKTRLFRANSDRNYVYASFEVFDHKNITITMVSRPIHPLAMFALSRSAAKEQEIIKSV